MPQEMKRTQVEEVGQDADEINTVSGTQVDGTVDALDAVLDDIESVLESNAEEYVSSFVQKGGE